MVLLPCSCRSGNCDSGSVVVLCRSTVATMPPACSAGFRKLTLGLRADLPLQARAAQRPSALHPSARKPADLLQIAATRHAAHPGSRPAQLGHEFRETRIGASTAIALRHVEHDAVVVDLTVQPFQRLLWPTMKR